MCGSDSLKILFMCISLRSFVHLIKISKQLNYGASVWTILDNLVKLQKDIYIVFILYSEFF